MTEYVRGMTFTISVDTNKQTYTFEGDEWDALDRALAELADNGLTPPPLYARSAGEGTLDAWRDLFFRLAKELGCLASSFPDGNGHVFEKAARLAGAGEGTPQAPSGEGAGEAVAWEKVLRDTTSYKEMLAQNRYMANFGEQAKGIEGVELPVGSTEAIARLLRDLVAWGFGMGQAEPESAEMISWHERAEAATAKIREHIASHAKTENLLRGLHKIVADLAPYFDKPLTEEAMPRWLALDSAQKVIAQYFAAPQGEAEREPVAWLQTRLRDGYAIAHAGKQDPRDIHDPGDGFTFTPLYARSAGEGTGALWSCVDHGVGKAKCCDEAAQVDDDYREIANPVRPQGTRGVREPTKYDQVPNGCWAACIAGLTGIPHETLAALVPSEIPDDTSAYRHAGFAYHNAMNATLAEHGWTLTYLGTRVPAGFAIGNGKSPRGVMHSVIVKDGVLWHDPHPSRAGCTITDYEYALPLALLEGAQDKAAE